MHDMKVSAVLENLEVLIDVPEGIDVFRSYLIGLATSGRLSEQHDSETPPEFCSISGPVSLPSNWIWASLEEIATYGGTGNVSPSEIGKDDWVLDLEDIEKGTSRLLKRVTSQNRPTKSNKARFKPGDVLYGKLRPYLDKVLVADRDGFCTTEIVPIVPKPGIDPHWLRISLKSPRFIEYVVSKSYGMKMPRLGTKDALVSIHAVPPLAEQKRIVAKVEELMALCDQLEQAKKKRDEIRTAARKSAIDAISTATTPEELETAWKRINNNWEVIADTPESVESLRGLILDLAVTDRLVECGDSRLSEEVMSVESPTSIWAKFSPKGWKCLSLEDASDQITDGTHQTPNYVETGVPFLSIKDISGGRLDFSRTRFVSAKEHKKLTERVKPRRGDVLICRIGTLGRAVSVDTDEEFSIFVSLGLIRPKDFVNPKFLAMLLNSPISYRQFDAIKAGGSHTVKLNLGALRKFVLWIPSKDSQELILSKVDELMTLCDQLESELNSRSDAAEKFARSVVSAA